MQLLNSQNTVRAAITALLGTSAIALSLSNASPAKALSLQNTTGIASPARTVTFNEFTFAQDTAITNQFSSLGVTFSPNLRYDLSYGGAGFPNINSSSLANFVGGSTIEAPTFSILFNTNQTQAAFAMVTNSGTSTFTALLNGAIVETFAASTSTSLSNNFYGFTGITFNEIRIVAGGINQAALIDNLQLSTATPVPFGFTPIPGLAVSGLLWSFNQLKRKMRAALVKGTEA